MNNGSVDKIVLYDGVCGLCNGAVKFIIARDKDAVFKFAALQSDAAVSLLAAHQLPPSDLDTVVLIEGNAAYAKSDAALRVAKKLNGLWPLLYAFIIVPKPLRDAVYNFIAANRYQWFGKYDQCMMPTPEMKRRILA
ncbi:MAG: thiol-disulfide oxidoreductase DCC family protein [Rhizobacter sp.]|nr:thiol-disulfide oxidoreductase DCC family protein [Chlorobiales bacterium]